VSGMIHLGKKILSEKGELQKNDYDYINKSFGIFSGDSNSTKLKIGRFIQA
jgi:hypothetical protein